MTESVAINPRTQGPLSRSRLTPLRQSLNSGLVAVFVVSRRRLNDLCRVCSAATFSDSSLEFRAA